MGGLIDRWIEEQEKEIRGMALEMFLHPETACEEHVAARTLGDFLKKNGFTVEMGAAGMDTAFIARWGQGSPVIGFLAEYDALPELGQKAEPCRSAVPGNGHGCGHNLLGAGAAAAGCALKACMEAEGKNGTVIVYGCPAEEICSGKIRMAQAGCFDGLEVAVSWHPSDRNQVSEDVFQAMVSEKFRFYGQSAHAAASPERGRSALDAAEIMNVAVNYLREHVPDAVRMHYVYTNAGEKPNVVPEFAELWYYVRADKRDVMEDARRRVELAAKGAAIATETRAEWEELTLSPETKLNYVLIGEMHKVLEKTGAPAFTEEELQFAGTLGKNLGLGGPYVDNRVWPLSGSPRPACGSTDVSEVSQRVPTVTLNTVCQVLGAPGHHWGITACAGSGFGMRGMLHAVRVMAHFGLELVERPELVDLAWKAFRADGR